MINLSDTEREQVLEALRLSLIYMQEHPSDTSPVKHVRNALKLLTEIGSIKSDCEENNTLQMVLNAIYDESDGSVLRPNPVIVERIKKYLGEK